MECAITLSRIGISKILLVTDFSPESENALQCSLTLARRYGSKLLITRVFPAEVSTAMGDTWPVLMDSARRSAEASMEQLQQREDLKPLPHEVVTRSSDTWDGISQVVLDRSIDLVVTGTHKCGNINSLIMGSIAEKVIRHAPCPVLTLGPHVGPLATDRFGHILYATDFSSGSLAALTYALSLAEQDRAELTMLHIIESKSVSDSYLIEWKRQNRENLRRLIPRELDLAYKPEIEVELGDPAEEILLLAETRNAELIVMGSHPGTLSTHFPWTTLHQVLQKAPCPVLTVRAT